MAKLGVSKVQVDLAVGTDPNVGLTISASNVHTLTRQVLMMAQCKRDMIGEDSESGMWTPFVNTNEV